MATWRWPTTSTYITTPVKPDHVALDIGAPLGAPVVAPTSGRVERIIPNEPSGYGNLVILRADSGERVLFGHLARFASIRSGQRVRPGQALGYVGSTGKSTGPHLHFEVRDKNNRQVSPVGYFGHIESLARPYPQMTVPTARPLSGRPIRLPNVRISGATIGANLRQKLGQVLPQYVTYMQQVQQAQQARQQAAQQAAQKPVEGALNVKTPVGLVSIPLPKIAWFNILTMGVGGVVALVSLVVLMQRAARAGRRDAVKLAKQIAPAAAMAAGPGASGMAAALVAASDADTSAKQAKAVKRIAREAKKAKAGKKPKGAKNAVQKKAPKAPKAKPKKTQKAVEPPGPTSKQLRMHRPFRS